MNIGKQNIQVITVLSSLILVGLFLPLNLSVGTIYLFIIYAVYLILKNKKFSFSYLFPILCSIFFIEHFWHYFIDIDKTSSTNEIIRKISFLFIPLLYLNLPKLHLKHFSINILKIYKYAMTVMGLTLLTTSIFKYLNTGDFNVFFYHELVAIFNGSAIYYSLLFTFSLIISLEEFLKEKSKFSFLFILLNSLIVLLLSSKIFGLLLLLLFLYFIIKSKKHKLVLSIFLLIILVLPFIFKGENIVKRYSETNFENVFSTKTNINQSTTFDGFALRKEMIKIGLNMSSINKQTILFGIGPGDTQKVLNEQIKERGFYTGKQNSDDQGFLNYNFHNQYMQSYVETGLVGLLTLLSILFYLIRKGVQENDTYLLLFNLVFLISFLTESFLSRQIGIFSFLVFNSILLFSLNNNKLNHVT